MKSLLNPKWIFIINTLPVLVLLFLGFQEFSVIKTLLKDEAIELWKNCAFWLLVLAFINFLLAGYLVLKNLKLKADFAIFMLISNIAFLYFYYYFFNDIIPSNIPQWMLSGETMFYVGTFLMPTLAYSLFVLVVNFTPENKQKTPWESFGLAILVPIVFYLLVQIIIPLYKNLETDYNNHLILFVIAGTLFFLFFLVRGIYIIIQKKSEFFKRFQLFWKILFTILLPIIGLLANAGFLFSGFSMDETTGIFGNFNSFWFYFLIIFNGLLLCIPNIENRKIRLLLFALRSLTFAVTFYFFIVFLPFLPLSVIAIVIIGLGFLMLSPLVLFLFHVTQLAEDFSYLKTIFSKNLLRTIAVIGFLVIPATITIKYLNDKKILTETLEFIYTPNYSKKYNIDKESLRNTIDVVSSYKDRRNSFSNSSKIPYLSSYFNWLVLDNLTLSDKKISTIEQVFFDKNETESSSRIQEKDSVMITNITTKSNFDHSQKAWKTWVDFEMTDKSETQWSHEFSTTFNLPEGVFISDYYLMIGHRKEFGILAEKKSALWIYNQITSENRDPGILTYLAGNKISFKVFPFTHEETRNTGIEFLHKEPVKIVIENQEIQLGNPTENNTNNSSEYPFVKYVSSTEKLNLKPIKRNPYFVFLVDASEDAAKSNKKLLSRIEDFKQKHSQFRESSRTFLVNSEITNHPNNDKMISQKFKGGYFLDRTIRKNLVQTYQSNETKYPIFIAVSDSIHHAILDKDFADLEFTFPENKLFYHLENNGSLSSYSLLNSPRNIIKKNAEIDFNKEVLPYQLGKKTYYLENNNAPSLILKSDQFELPKSEIKEKNWNSAILMQAKLRTEKLHPEIENKEWLSAVENSFKSKIMTPVTSYLVVENEAQKAALKRKQDQILKGNKSLDAEEEMQQMSEPSIYIFGILMVIFIAFWEYRKRKIMLNLQTKSK